MRTWLTRNEGETLALGAELAAELAPDGLLLLSGDLGTGKTVLARGLGGALGISPAEVQSPTYTLIREHQGSRGSLVHIDLYRLEPEEVGRLGLEELLAGPGIKVVEWAERLPFPVVGALRLRLERRTEDARAILEEDGGEPSASGPEREEPMGGAVHE